MSINYGHSVAAIENRLEQLTDESIEAHCAGLRLGRFVELQISADPNFTKQWGKKVKATFGRYSECRGHVGTRHVNVRPESMSLEDMALMIAEYGQSYRKGRAYLHKTVIVLRGKATPPRVLEMPARCFVNVVDGYSNVRDYGEVLRWLEEVVGAWTADEEKAVEARRQELHDERDMLQAALPQRIREEMAQAAERLAYLGKRLETLGAIEAAR